MLYREFCSSSIAVHAVHAPAALADGAGERHAQARLMRCIFGNPFRPRPVCAAWLTREVRALADGIYAERAFDRMPLLADAFEASGCTNADLIEHCRRWRARSRLLGRGSAPGQGLSVDGRSKPFCCLSSAYVS